jgi:BlaI family transcriptional regulator, penicillinase repressor
MKTRNLTEQELEIMKVVWDRKTATVREVYEALRERRTVAYTTVMTMMNILETKGHLVKRPEGRAYVYEPSQERTEVVGGMLQDFVDRVFDGAARPLVLSLIRERKLSKEDLEAVSRMIDEMEEDS